jgi:hypothetical protein
VACSRRCRGSSASLPRDRRAVPGTHIWHQGPGSSSPRFSARLSDGTGGFRVMMDLRFLPNLLP